MNSMIFAGGSSLRVLQSVVHLCAAGLGPDKLRLLVVEPDTANGSLPVARGVLRSYLDCQAVVRGSGNTKSRLFKTDLEFFQPDGAPNQLIDWSPLRPGQRLAEILNYDNMNAEDQAAVRLFFSEDELRMSLDQGFRGRTPVGTAVMSRLAQFEDKAPWNLVREKIRGDLTDVRGSRIVIAASVFGGTGASSIFPLARYLRTIPQVNPDRLKVAVTALLPYFRFERAARSAADSAEMAAKSEWFALSAKSAASFYRDLFLQGASPIDRMLWVGADTSMEVDYAPGGPRQQNPAHWVELVAALGSLEYLTGDDLPKGCAYACPRQDVDKKALHAIIDWDDLPLQHLNRRRLKSDLTSFLCVGIAHCGFFSELFRGEDITRQPRMVPWYWERFVSKGDTLIDDVARGGLGVLRDYFMTQYFPWLSQILAGDGVRLFNAVAIRGQDEEEIAPDLDRLLSLLWDGQERGAETGAFDRLFSDSVRVRPEHADAKKVAAYVDLLSEASRRFVKREYRLD